MNRKHKQIVTSSVAPVLEGLEGRRLMAGQMPLGIMLNDEVSSNTTQYNAAVDHLKSLGVSAVRLWITAKWGTTPTNSTVLDRAYDLKSKGFDVLLVVAAGERNSSSSPFDLPTPTETTNYFNALMNYKKSGSTTPLKDIVSKWEVGNEVNLLNYWNVGSSDGDYTARIDSYVTNMLNPAAATLKAQGEKVVSAGLAWGTVSGTQYPLKYLLQRLQSDGTLGNIDYIGYHPYANYSSQASIASNILSTVRDYGNNKPVLATEWDVNNPGDDATWASQNNLAFRNTVRDAYETTYYFATLDNSAWKGGAHRGASVLRHSPDIQNTNTLVENGDFYTTYNSWKKGSVAGYVWEDANADGSSSGESKIANRVVYIDANNNSARDVGEEYDTTAADGSYKIDYSLSPNDLNYTPVGKFTVRTEVPSGSQLTSSPSSPVNITAAKDTTGVNFGTRTTGGSLATISGYYFGDTNNDGLWNGSETGQSGKTMFIDADDDGTLDSGETSVTTDGTGKYTFGSLSAGTYVIRRSGLPSGYRFTTPADGRQVVTVAAGQTSSNNNIGGTDKVLISGRVFNDANADGTQGTSEAGVSGQTVYIDTNSSGGYDSGDASATTDANGDWQIRSLTGGTYAVKVLPVSPYQQVYPAGGAAISVPVANPTPATDVNFGIRTTTASGSITGVYWGDDNGNGVKDAGENGQSGKTMFLDADNDGVLDTGEQTAVTGTGGAYAFNSLAAGTYRVRRNGLPSGYRFSTPASGYIDVTLGAGETSADNDFLTTGKSSIIGHYFGDDDGDGVWDLDESGQAGKTMYLDADNDGILDTGEAIAVTDENGQFEFDNLTAGTYHVRRDGLPSGYRISTPGGPVVDVTLATATVSPAVDFGSTGRALISGTVFSDANSNGVKDSGETGLSGWTVYIDDDADGVLDATEESVTTAADGSYGFAEYAGTYLIKAVTQSGYTRTAPSGGSYSVTVANGATATGKHFGFH